MLTSTPHLQILHPPHPSSFFFPAILPKPLYIVPSSIVSLATVPDSIPRRIIYTKRTKTLSQPVIILILPPPPLDTALLPAIIISNISGSFGWALTTLFQYGEQSLPSWFFHQLCYVVVFVRG